MKRARADEQNVLGALALEYYKQRTSVHGTFAVTEAVVIAPQAGGHAYVPGLWNDDQIADGSQFAIVSQSSLTFPIKLEYPL